MNMVELLPSRVSTRADNVWVMLESSRFERVVDIQTVGHNGGPQFDIVPNERLDGVLANRLHASETNSAKLSLCIPFYRNKNQGLALRSAPACSFLLPADVSFVNFHPPSQMFPSAANHNAPKFLKPTPGCLVTPKTVGVAQILGAQPRLLRHHQPHYMKPQPQRLATILEHRSSRHRTLAPTFLAMPQTAFGAPRPLAPAFWTDETGWPSDPLKIRRAFFLHRKPLKKLLKGAWIRVFKRRSHRQNTTHCGHLSQSATQLSI